MTYKKRVLFEILSYCVIAGGFFILHSHVQLPAAQMTIFPFILVFFLLLNRFHHFIPQKIFLMAAFFAFLAFLFPYLGQKQIMVATLTGDDIEDESRIFWDELNQVLTSRGMKKAKRLYRTFKTSQEAGSEFAEKADDGNDVVIWGNKEWVNITFNSLPTYELLGYKLVGGVQNLPIPYQPRIDTAIYIASLLTAKHGIAQDGSISGEAELELSYLNHRQSRWLAGEHKAYPHFLLANAYLLRSYQDGILQKAFFDCAVRNYARALMYVSAKSNPELYAALLNNYGVALRLKSLTFGRDKKLLVVSQRFLNTAVNMRRAGGKLGIKYIGIKLAKKNLRLTNSLRRRVRKNLHKKRKNRRGNHGKKTRKK